MDLDGGGSDGCGNFGEANEKAGHAWCQTVPGWGVERLFLIPFLNE